MISTTYQGGVTLAISAGIRVVALGGNAAVVDDELEGVVHEAAVAARVVGGVAVDELLLRERHQFARHYLVYAFHCCYG